mgnify:CR=1 FL=1
MKVLDHKMVTLVLKPDLEHCYYDDYDDILVPMRDFYVRFQMDRVMEVHLMQLRMSVMTASGVKHH